MINFNFSIESINGTATVVDGTHFNRTTADTLCRMINSHVADDMSLLHIQYIDATTVDPVIVYADFFCPDCDTADGIMWRTYTVDADGYVEDTTFAA